MKEAKQMLNRQWFTPNGYVRATVICRTASRLSALGRIRYPLNLESLNAWATGRRGGWKYSLRGGRIPFPIPKEELRVTHLKVKLRRDSTKTMERQVILYPEQITLLSEGRSLRLRTVPLLIAWYERSQDGHGDFIGLAQELERVLRTNESHPGRSDPIDNSSV